MTKRELVTDVSESTGFPQAEVTAVIQTALDTITDTLAAGDRLEVRNFGVFENKTRDARVGRNPRTGTTVHIEEKRVPLFKPGKALKSRVESLPPPPESDRKDENSEAPF